MNWAALSIHLHPEEPQSGVSKDEGDAQILTQKNPPSFETRSLPQDEGFLLGWVKRVTLPPAPLWGGIEGGGKTSSAAGDFTPTPNPSPHGGGGHKKKLRFSLNAILFALCMSPAHAAEWKATERIKYYDVTGDTGLALYEAIGAKGPMFGAKRRAIGLTEYDLKWRRDYQAQSDTCRLASATPLLTITYSLPRAKPSGALARRWQAFAAGIETHERVHGAHIRDMVGAIIADTVGLTVENDAKCTKIRAEVLTRVKAALAAYIARTRGFEADEMGGNVQRLILGLVE